MLAGIGLSAIASLLGGLPILRVELRGEPARIQEVMGSLAARLFLVLAGLLYAILVGGIERTTFIVWVGLSYLVLLPVDIRYVLRGSRGSSIEE